MTETAGSDGTDHDRPRAEAKHRACLRCEAMFVSSWSGERICPHCKQSSAWRSGEAVRARPSGGSR